MVSRYYIDIIKLLRFRVNPAFSGKYINPGSYDTIMSNHSISRGIQK